jgi:hypothetical protein
VCKSLVASPVSSMIYKQCYTTHRGTCAHIPHTEGQCVDLISNIFNICICHMPYAICHMAYGIYVSAMCQHCVVQKQKQQLRSAIGTGQVYQDIRSTWLWAFQLIRRRGGGGVAGQLADWWTPPGARGGHGPRATGHGHGRATTTTTTSHKPQATSCYAAATTTTSALASWGLRSASGPAWAW